MFYQTHFIDYGENTQRTLSEPSSTIICFPFSATCKQQSRDDIVYKWYLQQSKSGHKKWKKTYN